jgi:ATP-dependent DNA helicase RecQ
VSDTPALPHDGGIEAGDFALEASAFAGVAERSLLDVLNRFWGFRGFRPLQREAMMSILDGRDSIVVLPTGGGKSLCFQAPALVERQRGMRGGASLALVVSPLIALMKDQVDGLRENGVPAACLNSAQSSDERARAHASLRDGSCRLLYV